MPSIRSLSSALGLTMLTARRPQDDETPNPCVSYGVDFQDKGAYFQNQLSNDNFTFVSQFEGCEADSAYNLLIDINGDQIPCSNTNLTPDNTNQLASCDILKSGLVSGQWSVMLFSNNGNARGIAYQRDFSLSVGPQSTSTYTPTVSETFFVTPVVSTTTTTYTTTATTLDPATVTSPSVTKTPTKTVTPRPVTSTSLKTVFTVSQTRYTVSVATSIVTKTASCRLPHRASTCDPRAHIIPTVGPAARYKDLVQRDAEAAKKRFVEEREARLENRAPDAQPLVVTDTDTSDWITTTSTSTTTAMTVTETAEGTITSTVTPSPVVVLKGKATAPTVTITAPTPTKYRTRRTVATTVMTKTINRTYTLTVTTTPTAVYTSCRRAGGILY